jgi:DNA polymerase III epsilon subunit-like protein
MLETIELTEQDSIDLALFSHPLVLIDLETTGFSPNWDRVIELAALRLERGKPPQVLSTLIDHGGRSTGAVGVHGITRQMLKGAPAFEELLGVLRPLCSGALMVAHNASFEERFLKAELERIGGSWGLPRLCTMMLSRRLFPHRKGRGAHSLEGIASELGYRIQGHHKALSDVLSLNSLLSRMVEQFKEHPNFDAWAQASTRSASADMCWPQAGASALSLKRR